MVVIPPANGRVRRFRQLVRNSLLQEASCSCVVRTSSPGQLCLNKSSAGASPAGRARVFPLLWQSDTLSRDRHEEKTRASSPLAAQSVEQHQDGAPVFDPEPLSPVARAAGSW